MRNKILITTLALCFLISCKEKNNTTVIIDQTYIDNLEQSRIELNERRLGYLELCGLFKITETEITLGLDSKNQISIDSNQHTKTLGYFNWNGKNYDFKSDTSSLVSDNSGSVIGQKSLVLDTNGDSEKLFFETYSWRIISRSGAPYLRVWNKENPSIAAFKGFECFKANPNFIFDAKFTYFDTIKSESVASKLGVNDVTTFVGQLEFRYNKKQFTLDVGENGWIMIADATSGDKTYGGGRYMYIDLPEKDETILLDFNLLYNPPCRYSSYTTCLFPPRQNVLPFSIEAGELINFKK